MTQAYQYQSFDDAVGLVDSYAKLRAMQLPLLVGKSFLDIGCNEGYYCGVALKAGARLVVGIDSFELAINRARKRFPAADFRLQTWDVLPEEKFDVILFSSAMHYIDNDGDIVALLTRIRKCLSDDGILILEVGTSPAPGNELVRVDRPDGCVHYPTWTKLVNLVNQAGMVWRRMGDSEPGDQHPRVVMHCRKIQPVVIFVRGASMSGKSYLANSLSNYGYWRIVHVDELLERALAQAAPEFRADSGDWPATLTRAGSQLSETQIDAIAEFFRKEVMARSELVASNSLPRQDPVIVDGFDPDHQVSEAIFRRVVQKLEARSYMVWDSRLLSKPMANHWASREGFVDCGGFLLPLSTEAGEARIEDQRIEAGKLVMKLKVDLKQGLAMKGVSIALGGSDSAQSVEIPESDARSKDIVVKLPLERMLGDRAGASDGEKLDRLRDVNMTVSAWTNGNQAFYLSS